MTEQARLLLSPPEVDSGNKRWEAAHLAWAARLERGVEAGLVSHHQALAAWRRATTRAAA